MSRMLADTSTRDLISQIYGRKRSNMAKDVEAAIADLTTARHNAKKASESLEEWEAIVAAGTCNTNTAYRVELIRRITAASAEAAGAAGLCTAALDGLVGVRITS